MHQFSLFMQPILMDSVQIMCIDELNIKAWVPELSCISSNVINFLIIYKMVFVCFSQPNRKLITSMFSESLLAPRSFLMNERPHLRYVKHKA